ncbi:MAG: T9SS type A sorting domain-containing protein [bacterium]
MKQIFTFICFVFLCISASQSQVLIAQWTFPTGNPTDSIADGGIPANLNKAIRTEGGTSAIDFSKNGFTTKAAQTTGWNDGADLKCWVVEITTTNYEDLAVSSKQQSGGSNPGPRDWKVQYRLGVTGTWTDVPNTVLNVQNDWTSGVLNNVELPAECKNQPSIFIRWIMTSNTNSLGDQVTASGINKIDDIIFTGKLINTAIPEPGNSISLCAYPNPCSEKITVKSDYPISQLTILDITGCVVITARPLEKEVSLDVSRVSSGTYVIKAWTSSSKTCISKVFVIL